jgi:hypothetical protein
MGLGARRKERKTLRHRTITRYISVVLLTPNLDAPSGRLGSWEVLGVETPGLLSPPAPLGRTALNDLDGCGSGFGVRGSGFGVRGSGFGVRRHSWSLAGSMKVPTAE